MASATLQPDHATRASVPKPRFLLRPLRQAPGLAPRCARAARILGRSHRAAGPKARLAEVIDRSRAILGMPADWRLGIVPGSDTGAVEMALWSMLGARPVDMLAFESFGKGWATDVVKQLKLPTPACWRRPTASCPTSPRSTRRRRRASPGTAPPPACASRTATSSPPTARAS